MTDIDFESILSGFLTVDDKDKALYNAINTYVVLNCGRPAFAPETASTFALTAYLLSYRFTKLIQDSKARVIFVKHENRMRPILLGPKPANNVVNALMRLDSSKSLKWDYAGDDIAFGQILGYGSTDSIMTHLNNDLVLGVTIFVKSANRKKPINIFSYYDRLNNPDAIKIANVIFKKISKALPPEWNEASLQTQKTHA